MNHKLTVTILFFVISWLGMQADKESDFKSDKVNRTNSNYSNYTSANCPLIKIVDNAVKTTKKLNKRNIVCELNLEYNPESNEAGRIRNIQLILNDSVSLFRSQTLFELINGVYTQVSLNELTLNYIRGLLYELYTNHNSIIKDEYINNDSLFMINGAKIWQIKMNLNGKNIAETHDLLDYTFSFDKPFNLQADKILELILAIKRKIEKDIYKLKGINYEPQKWITETFHDEYYLPYNDISSHNYQ